MVLASLLFYPTQLKYANHFDWLLIVASALFSICHGTAVPIAWYVFGDLTNLFANLELTLWVFTDSTNMVATVFNNYSLLDMSSTADNLTNIDGPVLAVTVDTFVLATQDNITEFLFTVFEQAGMNVTELNETIVTLSCVVYAYTEELEPPLPPYEVFNSLALGNLTLNATDGTCSCVQPLFTSFSEDIHCLTDDAFIFGTSTGDGVVWQIYYFLIIAMGVLISAYFQISLMQMAAKRQVIRIRKLYYQSVLRQDIGWFDCNPSGELATRLNE